MEPFEHGRVGAPSGECRVEVSEGSSSIDGGALRLEIDDSVAVGGLDAGVAEPMTNGHEIDAGLKHVDSGAVAQGVGMNAFASEAGRRGLGERHVFA